MNFTYQGYGGLLSKLHKSGYEIADYFNWERKSRCVILRHDVDESIPKAVEMAEFEQFGGVKATYFVLLTSDFYNVFSKESHNGLRRIMDCGHEIGLHFDEVRYPEIVGNLDGIRQKVLEEAEMLSMAIGHEVKTVSMHRPSKALLESDLQIPGIVNSYGKRFFQEFKYLSDSRRRWREPVDEIVEAGMYDRLHVLTHGFWYYETEKDIHDTISDFINSGNYARYQSMKTNITDLEAIMAENGVMQRDNKI